MSSNNNTLRFMGLTKTQFVGVLAILLGLVMTTLVFLVVQNRDLAQQGAESHEALCANRVQVAKQVADSRLFLSMTLNERIEKYGNALARIPEQTIRNSLRNQEAYLKSLTALRC